MAQYTHTQTPFQAIQPAELVYLYLRGQTGVSVVEEEERRVFGHRADGRADLKQNRLEGLIPFVRLLVDDVVDGGLQEVVGAAVQVRAAGRGETLSNVPPL